MRFLVSLLSIILVLFYSMFIAWWAFPASSDIGKRFIVCSFFIVPAIVELYWELRHGIYR
jgi:hypothetical protein